MNSLSKLSNLKTMNKSSILIRKNFCALTKVNEVEGNLNVNLFRFLKIFF